jgi:heme/copper-type cytochrome/quinol oxidase subunit 4
MPTTPSLTQYVGVVAFLTVVAFYTVRSLARGLSNELGLLALVVSLSIIQISVTYFLIRNWMDYATDGDTSRPARSTTGD